MRQFIYKLFFTLTFFFIYLIGSYGQSVIQLEKDGGVFKVPCVVNGLKLKLIFDTGASNVCISQSVALMMLENDYLSVNDIKGTAHSQVADGRIVDHTKINLRKIQIGDKVLTNVEAVVIYGQTAPLLLGQSALKRLGRYSISGDKLILGIESPKSKLTPKSNKRTLYDVLSEDYDLGSFEDFSINIEDESRRRKLYDAIKDKDTFANIIFEEKMRMKKWIVNIDLDFFWDSDGIKVFDDQFIRDFARKLNSAIKNIQVITIALSPDCIGGDCWEEKWKNVIRVWDIMKNEIRYLSDCPIGENILI